MTTPTAPATTTQLLQLTGMSCAACASAVVTNALRLKRFKLRSPQT